MNIILSAMFVRIIHAFSKIPMSDNLLTDDTLIGMFTKITRNHFTFCAPIFITGKNITGSESELELLKNLRETPYIYGYPAKNVFNYRHFRHKSCFIFIIWVYYPGDLIDIVEELKPRKLLNFNDYYIFHSQVSSFHLDKFVFTDSWSFIKDIPKSGIIEQLIPKIGTSNKELYVILKYDLFFSTNKFKKFLYNEGCDVFALLNYIPRSFNGLILNVTLLEYFPMVVINQGDGIIKYSGFEVELLNVISKRLNFKMHRYSPTDGNWGSLNKVTGKWNGMIQEVISGRANIAMSGIGVYEPRFQVIDYGYIYRQDCTSFVVPKAEAKPKWTVLGVAFEYPIWVGIALTLTISVFCLWFLTRELTKIVPENQVNSKLSDIVLTIISMTLQVSPKEHPIQTPTRILTITVWIFTIIVSVAYRSMLTSLLSLPRFSADLNTIEEIAESDLAVNMLNYGGGWMTMLRDGAHPVYKILWKKMKFIESIPDAVSKVKETRKNAVMDSRTNLRLIIINDFTDPITGVTSVHQITQCFAPTISAFVLQKESPYGAAIIEVTKKLVQAGFVDKWENDLIWEKQLFARKKRYAKTEDVSSKNQPLSLYDLQCLFVCLFIGISISTSSFITELLIYFIGRANI